MRGEAAGRCNVYIPLQGSQVFVYSTSTTALALITTSSLDIFVSVAPHFHPEVVCFLVVFSLEFVA